MKNWVILKNKLMEWGLNEDGYENRELTENTAGGF